MTSFLFGKIRKKDSKFFNEISKKYSIIKFDQKYLKSKVEFLDVLANKDEQQKLQTTLFKKKKERNFYLHPKI